MTKPVESPLATYWYIQSSFDNSQL